MLRLIVLKVFALFWLRWWEISLCCCHPLEYDLGVVLYVLCHFVHVVWDLDWILDALAFISDWHVNMAAASHCRCFSQCVGRGQGSAAGAAEDHMTCMLDALKSWDYTHDGCTVSNMELLETCLEQRSCI